MPLTPTQISEYCSKTETVEEGEHWRTLCPSCKHPNKKFYIHKDTGVYHCFHCETVNPRDFNICQEQYVSMSNTASYSEKLTAEYVQRCEKYRDGSNYRTTVYGYLMGDRHLTVETIQEWRLGYDPDENAIVIPGFKSCGNLTTISLRYLSGELRYKTHGSKGCFYKYPQRLPNSSVALVYEGEMDAITSSQLFPGYDAYSTQGKSICKDSLKKMLEVYERVYICFDDDTSKEVEKLGNFLDIHRCWDVTFPVGMDLNDIAKYPEASQILAKCLFEARPMLKPLLSNIGERVDSCIAYFNGEKYNSVSTGFEALDYITGGIRPGELYVITGDSGLGKSTLCIKLALSLASSGFKTSICSLELPFQSHVAPKLISFIKGKNIEIPPRLSAPEYKQALIDLDKWGNINLVNRIGSLNKSEIKLILDRVHQKGYKCIILDHLQFMVNKEDNDEINEVVRILVDFLKEHLDFTIMLVAHARKPTKDFKTGRHRPLEMYDLKGSSSLYQEPDNVWILNRLPENDLVTLKVGKLRSDKTSVIAGGKVMLYFNKNTFKYNVVPG